jgi:hypothetical protein
VRLAALADVYGGGTGLRLLTATDPAESVVLQAKAIAAAELARRRDERLARMIANGVARTLGGR